MPWLKNVALFQLPIEPFISVWQIDPNKIESLLNHFQRQTIT